MKKGILAAFAGLVGAVGAGAAVNRVMSKNTAVQKQYADKHLNILENLNQWLRIKQEGKTLKPYFESHGYKRIAIYGMGHLGERLLDDLKQLDVIVAYAIDQNADNLYSDVELVTPEDNLEDVDAVIVTATFFYDEIEQKLSSKMDCPIVSLEDVLYWE